MDDQTIRRGITAYVTESEPPMLLTAEGMLRTARRAQRVRSALAVAVALAAVLVLAGGYVGIRTATSGRALPVGVVPSTSASPRPGATADLPLPAKAPCRTVPSITIIDAAASPTHGYRASGAAPPIPAHQATKLADGSPAPDLAPVTCRVRQLVTGFLPDSGYFVTPTMPANETPLTASYGGTDAESADLEAGVVSGGRVGHLVVTIEHVTNSDCDRGQFDIGKHAVVEHRALPTGQNLCAMTATDPATGLVDNTVYEFYGRDQNMVTVRFVDTYLTRQGLKISAGPPLLTKEQLIQIATDPALVIYPYHG
jgi:hypothetical protein